VTDPPHDPPELCIRAAQLRAQTRDYGRIAAELGLDSPDHARKCAQVGFSLVPQEDLATLRRALAREKGEIS
jgi:hypothetical protein